MAAITVLQPNVLQGTVTSSVAPWEAGKMSVQAKGLLNDADLQDASKTMTICLEESFDGGVNWQSGPKATWQGNQADPFHPGNFVAPNVGAGYANSGVTPSHVRVRLELPSIISVGASVSFS